MIEEFLKELDENWKPLGVEPITLRIIGSTALMLQTPYERGTKDTDILEAQELTPAIQKQLLQVADRDSKLYKKYRMYLEIVARVIPFLPRQPLFHSCDHLNKSLQYFKVEALDIMDVIVSKLKPFRHTDRDDIVAMVDRGFVDHQLLVTRFESAVDRWLTDARSEDFPEYIKNLNKIEREYLKVKESVIELPRWLEE